MGKEKGAEYYDQVFKDRKMFKVPYRRSPYWVSWTQVIAFIQKAKEAQILDIGCGPGQLANYLRDEGFHNYVGFDFSEEAIRSAKATNPQMKFFVGDALDEKSYDHPYDTVICLEVLEHLKQDREILMNIKEGARVIFSVPNFWDPSHVRIFTSYRKIKRRYYRLLHIRRIVRIDNLYVCDSVRSDFRPNLLQWLLKSREEVTVASFTKRIMHYLRTIKTEA